MVDALITVVVIFGCVVLWLVTCSLIRYLILTFVSRMGELVRCLVKKFFAWKSEKYD